MQELSLDLIFASLLAKLKWIVASVAVGILLFASYACFFIPDAYTSSVLVYVRNVATGTQTNSATASNLSASGYLANTYAVALKTSPVLTEASAELRGALTAGELSRSVSVSSVEDTSFLRISAVHGDPKTAQLICSTIARVSANAFEEIGEVGSAKVIGEASAASKTAPNVTRTAVFGALAGAILSTFYIILRELLNNTVRDKLSLQAQIPVPVLGEIPSFGPATKKRGNNHD
ncbi:MAG: hypothetical protein J6Q42_04500 [Clostridia bacterium]|jgi:receptor protein-tyrosine kinase|nr:hypothetical protein [Clostridia bacterium]